MNPYRILAYIQRMRAIRRWAREYDDSDTYYLANDEVQWWKQVLQRLTNAF